MITERISTRVSYAILLLFSVSGCETLSSFHLPKHHSEEVSELPIPTVDVGGDVVNPGRLEIPIEGMSLRRALTLVGGLRERASVTRVGSVSVDAQVVTEIEKRARDVGKYFDLLRVWTLPGPKPDETAEALKEKLDESEGQLKQFKDQLNIDLSLFDKLERASKALGGLDATIDLKRKNNLPIEDDLEAKQKVDSELRDAKERLQTVAAGASLMLNSQPSDTYLVALQRVDGNAPITYYFPYEIAQTGTVGEIELKPRDLVQVVDYRSTSLNVGIDVVTAARARTQNHVVAGYVRNPGIQQTDVGMRIEDAISASSPAFGSANDAWTIVRQSRDGTGNEVFVLPSRFATGAFRSARVIPGDVYNFNTIQSVPIVFESLARRALLTPTREELRERLLAERTRGEAAHDRWDQRVQERIANGGVGSGVLRNLQSVSDIWNVRTGGPLSLVQ